MPEPQDHERAAQAASEALARAKTIPLRDHMDVGESVGFYRVKESSPLRLRLQTGSGLAIGLVALGAAFVLLDAWLLKTGTLFTFLDWWHKNEFRRSEQLIPSWVVRAGVCALVGLPLLGLLGFLLLGRSVEFGRPADGAAGAGGVVIRKRRMWIFGPSIDAGRVAAAGVLVRPGYSATACDRIMVRLLDESGKPVLEVADEASDGEDVGAALAMAAQLGEVLGKPVRVEGKPKEMADGPRDAIRRFREKLGASA